MSPAKIVQLSIMCKTLMSRSECTPPKHLCNEPVNESEADSKSPLILSTILHHDKFCELSTENLLKGALVRGINVESKQLLEEAVPIVLY